MAYVRAAAGTPAARMRQFVRRWMKGEKAIRTLKNVAQELARQKEHPVSDTRTVDSFVGLLVSWAVEAHRKLEVVPEPEDVETGKKRHRWKGRI